MLSDIKLAMEEKVGQLEAKVDRLVTVAESNVDIEKEVRQLETKMGGLDAKMDAKMDGLEAKMDTKMDGLEAKMDEVLRHLGVPRVTSI